MKFLLDENLPASFSELLQAAGYEANHVSEVNLENTEDDDIVLFAIGSGLIIITYDLDFGRIISISNKKHPSLITIRLTKLNSLIFTNTIKEVIASCSDDLNKGAMITVDDDRIRVRQLPVFKKSKK